MLPLFSSQVKLVCENFASPEKANEIESFFASNVVPGSDKSARQAVESIRLKSFWLHRDADAIKKFFVGSN